MSMKIRDSAKPMSGGLYSGVWYQGAYQAPKVCYPAWTQNRDSTQMAVGWLDPQTDPTLGAPPMTGRP